MRWRACNTQIPAIEVRHGRESKSKAATLVLHLYIYRTEIKPGKHSDTRKKPLPWTNGHGRIITVTPERKPVSVVRWGVAVT